jgi:hypothetical protein
MRTMPGCNLQDLGPTCAQILQSRLPRLYVMGRQPAVWSDLEAEPNDIRQTAERLDRRSSGPAL